MATIQQRDNGTHRAIIRKLGAKLSKTFDTEEEAQQWAAAIEARLVAGFDAAQTTVTLSTPVRAIINKYMREVSPTKRGCRTEQQSLGALLERYSVFDKPVATFGAKDIEAVKASRLRGSDLYRAVQPGTVIRELGALSACFSYAIKKWGCPWVENPVHNVDRPQAPPPRFARIPDAQIDRVCAHLGYVRGTVPTHAKHYVAWGFLFAVETAMRRGEILGIQRKEVFVDEYRVHLPLTKNGTARDVPLSSGARALLALLPEGAPDDYLIKLSRSYFSNLWQMTRKATGIDFKFHDTRHESTTRIARKLTNVLELSAVTGHKDLRMLKIYFNPTSAELAARLG